MKILFIHQNFPGQFKHLAPELVRQGHQVVAMTMQQAAGEQWNGVRVVKYHAARGSTKGVHPWVTDFETKVIRGEACFRAAQKLHGEGFSPDVVIAHPGWGESLFLKEVWPQARIAIYCEFYYKGEGADTGFDPEFPPSDDADACRLKLKNLNNLLHFEVADAGISPTEWQASTFPQPFRDRISVIHDGIDTRMLAPNPAAALTVKTAAGASLRITRDDEVITFVNRNLEPYRGYHIFMRALPRLLRERPNCRVLIVGGNGASYGARPDPKVHGAGNWKDVYINEVRGQIPDQDWARVHFVGNVPYNHFVSMLQLSRAHVYLTYPFVLSWSLLEAMSCGCAIVASDTQPLREAIIDRETGLLVDFFDGDALVRSIGEVLDDAVLRAKLGEQAREFARTHYDLQTVCLPRQIAWVNSLA